MQHSHRTHAFPECVNSERGLRKPFFSRIHFSYFRGMVACLNRELGWFEAASLFWDSPYFVASLICLPLRGQRVRSICLVVNDPRT